MTKKEPHIQKKGSSGGTSGAVSILTHRQQTTMNAVCSANMGD